MPFAALVIGAVLLEARRPRRGVARARPARRRRAAAAGGVGARRPLLALPVAARRDPARARRGSPRWSAVAPVIWAAMRPDRHRRRAALAARDGGARRGGRPPPQPRAGAVLDRAVLRLHAARAAAARHADRARVRVALPAPARAAAARRRRGDDGRVRGRPGLRAAADRPLRRTPAVLLALFYGLAVCGWLLLPRGPRAQRAGRPSAVLAAGASVVYVPWHVDKLAGLERRIDRDGRLYADLAASRARRPRARRVRPLRAARRPPTTARSRTCATGSTAHPGSVAHGRGRTRARWAGCCCCRAATASTAPLLPERTSRGSSRRPATGRSTATASWRVFAAPGCADCCLDVLHRHRVGTASCRRRRGTPCRPRRRRVGSSHIRSWPLCEPDRLVAELLDRAQRVADEQDRAGLAAQLAHPLRTTCAGSARRRPTAPRR